MKLSYANMLGEICDRLNGADVSIVAEAIGRDTRIGKKYLKPAVGYGGPCFPRDTIAFSRVANMVGGTADLALATDKINRRQISRLTELVREVLPAGGAAAVLGLSYKPSTSVIEESQGIMLAKSLKDAGFSVVAHDPMASEAAKAMLSNTARLVPSAREALVQSDGVVIITPWPEYAEISPRWIAGGPTRVIIDCWRQLDPASFAGICRIVQLGHQQTIAAAATRLAAE
jgi:UDPglucose 6-dehydrogenase